MFTLASPAPETNLEQVRHLVVVGNFKDGPTLSPIDVNDDLEVRHVHQVLNGSRDIDGNVELSADDPTNRSQPRKPDLMRFYLMVTLLTV